MARALQKANNKLHMTFKIQCGNMYEIIQICGKVFGLVKTSSKETLHISQLVLTVYPKEKESKRNCKYMLSIHIQRNSGIMFTLLQHFLWRAK